MIDYQSFRRKFVEWLEKNIPSWWSPSVEAIYKRVYEDKIGLMREWQAKLYDEGWLGYGIPEEYGGWGRDRMYDLIVHEEIARRTAPPVLNRIGLITAAPLIVSHGTEEQKKRYIRPLLRGEEIWCQGFSEPNAGSDLAALSCRADRKGDYFIVNGQKVWSSLAHIADYCLLLCRTRRYDKKHKGITCMIVDMKSEGVTVSPITQITGEGEFNQIFFDDVKVPVSNVIGKIDEGWGIAMATLNHERLLLTSEVMAKASAALDRLADMLGRYARNDPYWKIKFAELWAEREAIIKTFDRMLRIVEKGDVGPETSLIKIAASEFIQRVYSAISELVGGYGLLSLSEDGLAWQKGFFWTRGRTIASGTSEILRNVVAERILGMPR